MAAQCSPGGWAPRAGRRAGNPARTVSASRSTAPRGAGCHGERPRPVHHMAYLNRSGTTRHQYHSARVVLSMGQHSNCQIAVWKGYPLSCGRSARTAVGGPRRRPRLAARRRLEVLNISHQKESRRKPTPRGKFGPVGKHGADDSCGRLGRQAAVPSRPAPRCPPGPCHGAGGRLDPSHGRTDRNGFRFRARAVLRSGLRPRLATLANRENVST